MKQLISQKGFAALFITILILAIILAIGLSVAIFTLGQQKIAGNIIKSSQAYFTAEAGTEDALLKLAKQKQWSSPYSFEVGDGSVTVEISDIIGGSRTITSKGDVLNRIRNIEVLYTITTEQISFYYGAQVGDGGMEMGNNARVEGNVFSNGSVIASKGGDKGYIDDTVKVATIGSRIEGLIVGEDAYTHNCKNCMIGGTLYFSGGGSENCEAEKGTKDHPVQKSQDLPISQSVIEGWKNDAASGGVIDGDYVLDGKVTDYLGPKKITGNMLLDNKATLIITGTILVVGDITVRNGATIRLDSNYYGGIGGVLIVDGKIKIRPGVTLEGSGQEGSYLLLLSTNDSLDKASPAIDIDNTTQGAIFYTTNGLIVIRNNVEAREVTGYQIYLDNNAIIHYEAGLEDAEFSSGPGGSWKVISWREIE